VAGRHGASAPLSPRILPMLVVSVTSIGSCVSKNAGAVTDLATVSWSWACAPSGVAFRSAAARGKTTGTRAIVLRVTGIGTASADYDRISWCRLFHAIVFSPRSRSECFRSASANRMFYEDRLRVLPKQLRRVLARRKRVRSHDYDQTPSLREMLSGKHSLHQRHG